MAKLLVVDDDHDLADSFAEVLRAEGHVVRVAKNGREGLARLAEDAPDLILCDVEMPVMDGPGMALQVFLRNAGQEKIPILLLSGVADLHRIAKKVGTPYFLVKPFSVEKLRSAVTLALTEKKPPLPSHLQS